VKIQIGNTERDMTEAEIAQYNKDIVDANAEQATKAAARQAVLDKLGLTADEVTALLG
jgi:hypothetical protein